MKYKFLFILLFVFIFILLGCTSEENPPDIIIPEDQKLEDTTPGWFIKAMKLDYSSGKYLTVLMHEQLDQFGKRIDSFKDENDDLNIIWEYNDYSGITDKYKKTNKNPNPINWYWFGHSDISIYIEEKLDKDGEHPPSFTFRYPPPGIPWTELIGAENIGHSTHGKAMIIIRTKSDQKTRLFLFGQGAFCTETLIF